MRSKTSWRAGLAVWVVAAAGLALAGACTPAAKSGGAAVKTAAQAGTSGDAVAEAQQIFEFRCTPCHGAQGHGDGPGAASLDPKPRNFGDATWQGSVNDEHIEKIIMYGGSAVGRSPNMPANPDLNEKPEVVKALRAHVRSLAGK